MHKSTKTLLATIFLVLYLAVLLKLFVFKFTTHLRSGVILKLGGYGNYGYNLVPFKTIVQYLREPFGLITIGNLLGNIVLFMPLGFLLPFIYPRISWKGVFGIAVAFSLCIEILQFTLRAGIPDIDDIILNTLGALLGYVVFLLVRKWRYSKFK